jgi:hypothetical protein
MTWGRGADPPGGTCPQKKEIKASSIFSRIATSAESTRGSGEYLPRLVGEVLASDASSSRPRFSPRSVAKVDDSNPQHNTHNAYACGAASDDNFRFVRVFVNCKSVPFTKQDCCSVCKQMKKMQIVDLKKSALPKSACTLEEASAIGDIAATNQNLISGQLPWEPRQPIRTLPYLRDMVRI